MSANSQLPIIPYGRQCLDQADLDAVQAVLKSDFLTQGPMVEQFEKAVAQFCGVSHGIAVSNATAALHLACLALDLGPGDRLWTSPNSFLASANCALYCGAQIDFVDIDPHTYNMSPTALEAKLVHAEQNGQLPKIVVPVHFAGQSCEMEAIAKLAKKYGFAVLEDASHALGGRYLGQPVGSCHYSDAAVFSFHPVKMITTGEGGMVVTNKPELARKLALLRSHGMTRDPERMDQPSEGPWYYQQVALGYNYRITDLQCALGLSQFHKLERFVERRNLLAKQYHQQLEHLPLILPMVSEGILSSFHLYAVQMDPTRVQKSRREVFEGLKGLGIGVQVHYIPIHTQPFYRKLGFKLGQYPVAELYYQNCISLPLFAALSDLDQIRVVQALETVLK